ncbi:sol [Symbiodinium necroappetens]|uniref:Sol protein n=1 Tax=Symbiodinium necroappetens TaxID=1628268 RepID=A0A813BAL8_9DINO|nr:sol [Symbiodinium necroappetens]
MTMGFPAPALPGDASPFHPPVLLGRSLSHAMTASPMIPQIPHAPSSPSGLVHSTSHLLNFQSLMPSASHSQTSMFQPANFQFTFNAEPSTSEARQPAEPVAAPQADLALGGTSASSASAAPCDSHAQAAPSQSSVHRREAQRPAVGVCQEPMNCDAQLKQCIAECRRVLEAKAAQCRSAGKKYFDPDFPSDSRSLWLNGLAMTEGRKLFVAKLPTDADASDIREDEMEQVFSTYGPVEEAILMDQNRSNRPDERCGFVIYKSADAAQTAIQVLNNVYRFREEAPDAIHVSMARSRAKGDGKGKDGKDGKGKDGGHGGPGDRHDRGGGGGAGGAGFMGDPPGRPVYRGQEVQRGGYDRNDFDAPRGDARRYDYGPPGRYDAPRGYDPRYDAPRGPDYGPRGGGREEFRHDRGYARDDRGGYDRDFRGPDRGPDRGRDRGPDRYDRPHDRPERHERFRDRDDYDRRDRIDRGYDHRPPERDWNDRDRSSYDRGPESFDRDRFDRHEHFGPERGFARERPERQGGYDERPPGGRDGGKGGQGGAPGTKIYVGNLPTDISKQALSQVFSSYGQVEDVHIMTGRSKSGQASAFVRYYNSKDANDAILAMAQGYEIRQGDGHIVVRLADGEASYTIADVAAYHSSWQMAGSGKGALLTEEQSMLKLWAGDHRQLERGLSMRETWRDHAGAPDTQDDAIRCPALVRGHPVASPTFESCEHQYFRLACHSTSRVPANNRHKSDSSVTPHWTLREQPQVGYQGADVAGSSHDVECQSVKTRSGWIAGFAGMTLKVIAPGALGSFHLQGALAMMRSVGKDPNELIVHRDADVGIYGVRFFKDGRWIYEVLDDLLPESEQRQLSSSCNGQEWPALIEKAYAKLHGCYEAVATGAEEDAMEDLLGAGSGRFAVSDFPVWAELWQHLRSKRKRGFALAAIRRREAAGEVPSPLTSSAHHVTVHARSC